MQTVSTSWFLPRAFTKLLSPGRDCLPTEVLRCEFARWPIELAQRHQAWCEQFVEHPRTVSSFAYLPLQQAQLATMLHPHFGPSMLGLVHVRQQFSRVALQDWPQGRFAIDSHWRVFNRAQRRGVWLDCEQTIIELGSNQALLVAKSRYLSRQPWSSPLPNDGAAGNELNDNGPFQRIAQWTLHLAQGRTYAHLSGDWNPIHLSHVTARLFGQPQALVHGAALVSLVEQLVPDSPLSYDVRFLKPVRYHLPIDIGRINGHQYQVRQAGAVCLTWQSTPA